jgi:cytosine/uracil/thiamine/allantoin permease
VVQRFDGRIILKVNKNKMQDNPIIDNRENTSLINEDLAPIPPEKRKWGTWNYAALWISMSLCIPTYMLASSLIGGGMNWWQAILTIFLGNTIVLIPMILNGHAGAKYGIPFPVLREPVLEPAVRISRQY